eukprot:g18709.t2
MSTLEKSPIIRQLDRRKVDQHRKQLRRLPGESLESYVTRGSIYRTQLQALDEEMQMGECFYTGHLLDNAKLTRRDKVMIKTRAGSDYEDDERHDDLEGEHGFPIGSSEPNVAARHGDDFLIQREEKGRKGVNAADFEGASLYGIEEEGPHIDEKTFPPELDDAENEAFAMHFKAKQKIAEVRKLRQYFKRPDQEEKKRLLAEKMRTSPCHRCGELGHWSRECPRKGHSAGATAKPEDSERSKQELAVAPAEEEEQSAGWSAVGVAELSKEEQSMILKRREKTLAAKNKKANQMALTGSEADHPSLSTTWSAEMALNLAASVRSRMKTYLWKKFLWQMRVKQGVEKEAKERAALIQNTAKTEERYVVLEISAGMARLSEEAIDLLYGHDLRQNDTQKRVFDIIHEHKPDLVTLSMPCGPWCSWMRLAPEEKLDELRAEHLTLWRFARKAFHVYISHNAIAGVPLGQYVNPKYILPSRMVFTNKGAKELINALLKARWAFDGHRDPEAGQHQTAAPTVSLVGHNLLIFLAAQHRWTIVYEDVSAAFLQGQELPPEREIYVKVPHQYPQEVLIELHEMLGPGSRKDIVKLTEGGFGLPESPRLWYLEYRQTLCDLGGRELKLAPGFSCFYNDAGQQVQQRALQRAALPVIFVSAAVANRVSNRVLLAPLLKHTYFLALTTTIAQLAAYVGWLQLRLRKGRFITSMWSFAKRNPALIAAFGLCEGAFFPLVFYSAARLPGSLVQVLNQTLIPSTVVLSILFLRKRYDAVQIIGVVEAWHLAIEQPS